jgi:hypothetical protein
MPVLYYRPLSVFVASLSLLLLAACGPAVRETQADAAAADLPQNNQQASANDDGGMDTETSLLTILGLQKKPSKQLWGPKTGTDVSPELWQAALDTLNFVKMDSEDPQAGLIVTNWYSPKDKPDERMRVTVFIKSRALRSDSMVVTIDRQTRSPGAEWADATVSQKTVDDLDNDILQRAREVHIARLRLEQ